MVQDNCICKGVAEAKRWGRQWVQSASVLAKLQRMPILGTGELPTGLGSIHPPPLHHPCFISCLLQETPPYCSVTEASDGWKEQISSFSFSLSLLWIYDGALRTKSLPLFLEARRWLGSRAAGREMHRAINPLHVGRERTGLSHWAWPRRAEPRSPEVPTQCHGVPAGPQGPSFPWGVLGGCRSCCRSIWDPRRHLGSQIACRS